MTKGKFIKVLAILFCCLFIFTGCDSKMEYEDKLKLMETEKQQFIEACYDLENRNQRLIEENEQLQSKLNYYQGKIKVNFSGGFVAKVHDTSPSFLVDSTTNNTATVSLFQDIPFMIWIGPEISEFPELDNIYFFEIKGEDIEMTNYEYENLLLDPEILLSKYPIRINSFRHAKDDEWGLEANKIVCEIT